MMSSTRSGCIITLPEPRSKEASIDNLVKSGHAVSEIRERERTDRQTDRQADMLIAIHHRKVFC